MKESEKLVSICIPSYNGADYIKETIQSTLGQTYRNIEIIIIDDVSTDSSWSIIKSFKDDRIHAQRNESNLGLIGNFRRVLEEAHGEYLTILCNDDVLFPNSIKNMVSGLENFNQCSFAFGNVLYIGDRQGATGYSFPELMPPGRWVEESLKHGKNLTYLVGTLFRRSSEPIEKVVQDLIFFDWYLWLKLGQQFVYFSKELVGMHRYHHKNQTKLLTPDLNSNYRNLKLVIIKSQCDNIISEKQKRRGIASLALKYAINFISKEKGTRNLVRTISNGFNFYIEETSHSIISESRYYLKVGKVLLVKILRWLHIK